MSLAPFSILSYYGSNPSFWQIGQNLLVSPTPGFSAASYSLGGTLPAGITFNTTTGVFSGIPTNLTPATTLTVTATLANSTTTVCTVIMSIVDIPETARLVNQASATSHTALTNRFESLFLTSAEQLINNANSMGKFSVVMELRDYVSFNFVYNYFTNLNFTVVNLYPSNNYQEFSVYYGGYGESFPNACFPSTNFPGCFDDFTQPYPVVAARLPRRVRITWTPYAGYQPFPYAY